MVMIQEVLANAGDITCVKPLPKIYMLHVNLKKRQSMKVFIK